MIAARYCVNTTVYSELPAEAAAHEEPAALAQEPPDHRQVEVDAGGHVRNRKAVLVDRVGEQQVVHVAAMAGHVDDFVAVGDLAERLDVRELDAVVEPVPHPRQEQRHDGHEAVRIVGGDLIDAAARLEQRRRGAWCRGVRARSAPPPGAPRASAAPRQRSCGGARGPDRCARRARAPAARAAPGRRGARPSAVSASPPSRLRSDTGSPGCTQTLRPLTSTAKRAPQPAAERPVLGQQQANQRTFFLRRATPVHADRHQRDIERRDPRAARRSAPSAARAPAGRGACARIRPAARARMRRAPQCPGSSLRRGRGMRSRAHSECSTARSSALLRSNT